MGGTFVTRSTRIVLIAALAAPPALFAASPAQAAKKMEVALQDDAVLVHGYGPGFPVYDRHLAFRQLRDLGVSRLRMNVIWSIVNESQSAERKKPRTVVYDWSRWDAAIALAKAYGMKVHLNLTGDPPRWACGNKKLPGQCNGYKPNARQFGKFARATAKHFGRKVDRYSIWNEPNWHTWLSPHRKAPLLYRKLYQQGYKGIKKGNRRAKVLMGETAPYFQKGRAQAPLDFLRDMVCVNKRLKKTRKAKKKCKGKLKLDGYAHHPYDFEVPPTRERKNKDDVTMANLDRLTEMLDKMRKKGLIKGKKKLPLYLTETGYFVSGERRISERKRGRYTVKAFKMAQKNRRVKSQLYYLLVSPPAGHSSYFFDLGLIAQDGQPYGAAYNKLRKWVKRAAKRKQVAKPKRCAAAVRSNC